MNEEKILDFRERVQPQIRDYLKAAHIKISEDGVTTMCPICGDIAGLMKDDTWLCMHCGKRGDLLDYVLCGHPSMKKSGAMRHIQRTLGETILELDAVNANDLMEMAFKPTGWLIEKILGKGVYILAGASKIGKSWLVLWLADRVSKGEKVWEFRPRPVRCCMSAWRTPNSASSSAWARSREARRIRSGSPPRPSFWAKASSSRSETSSRCIRMWVL